MNAKENSPSVNPRLKRIRIFSRVLKLLLFLYFVFSGFYPPFVQKTPDGYRIVSGAYATISEAPMVAKLIVVAGAGLFLAAIIFCYQLLSLYEKGFIFSARNVQLLGRIGYVAFGYGLLGVCGPMLLTAWNGYMSGSLPISFFLGFSYLLCSPFLIGGLFVVVVSHIMGEGWKIREEQELTI